MRVATFFPFQTTYYLNGHSYIEQELNRAQIGFRKNDNAFLAVDDVAALQAAADKLSPAESGQICSVGRRKIAKKIAKNKRCYANTLRPRSSPCTLRGPPNDLASCKNKNG
jgi:hypothetical protein